ncbi:glycosyltransferase family 4 protein [Gorillibacterium sp. sgz5001074]|uniref:glycosyltransferase family 4 protein n=1 Tax=Gorillibacterium sp. sgz5001074 TaxID=3446695 RepID=UPI003F66CDCF
MAKILHVCAIDLSVEALLKPLIDKSMGAGYIVHNACSQQGRFDRLQEQGLTMIDIPIARQIHPIKNIKSIYLLYRLMRKEKYDIVHVHTPVAAILGRIAAKFAGTKNIVYTAHGFYFHEDMPRWKYSIYFLIEWFFARFFTDVLLVQSKEDFNLCLRTKFKQPEQIMHLSNGVDVNEKFTPHIIDEVKARNLRSSLKIESDDIVFAFIGRFVKEKGICELIDAFELLQKEFNHVKLLLIGELPKSERNHELHQLADTLKGNSNIIVTGYRKDVAELLRISDVFVLPSYREGLPRSIIEAMAMEKPVIATNIRGCREEVINGHNGYLVKKGDPKDLYRRMRDLVIHPKDRHDFGKAGREIALELFNENKVIEKQLQLYKNLYK